MLLSKGSSRAPESYTLAVPSRSTENSVRYSPIGKPLDHHRRELMVKRKSYNCPVEAAVDVFGGKWKAQILWWLQQRTWRFAELRRQDPATTEKMLAQQLRELEADGIVDRRVY